MAGRQLQRLLKERQLLELEKRAKAEEANEEESDDDSKQDCDDFAGDEQSYDDDDEGEDARAFNPFSLLTSSDEEGESIEDGQSSDGETDVANGEREAKGSEDGMSAEKNDEGRIIHAMKGKGKGKKEEEEEDIDAILEELRIQPQELVSGEEQRRCERRMQLLHIDTKSLKAEDELRRMFGSDATRADRLMDGGQGGADEMAGASRRVRRLAARGLVGRYASQKRGLIITPTATWPVLVADDMKLQQTGVGREGKVLFSYVASPQYEVRV